MAYPGRVLSIDAAGALIETEGRRQRASLLLLPEVVVGDWVVVAAGTVINRLEPDEAAEIRTLLDRAQEASASPVVADEPAGHAPIDA